MRPRSYKLFCNFATVMENKSSTILEGLNSEQKAAVGCVDGPVLIVAGAGSGKTRVLTSRIAYILEQKNLDPSRILALTFTKKAASEMKERIALMVGERKARRLYMGTFHSVFIRFLREFSESLGYPATFTIYDTSDSVSAIKTCLKELQLDEKVYKPKDVLSRISMAKNNLVTAEAYRRNPTVLQNDASSKKPRICDVYQLYSLKCRQAGVMDFDDILLNMNILLRDNPAALESIAGRFDYIMVDEYQDTNFAQYLILKKLSQFHHNLCVVGDDSQSIYAFRGAKIENILNFKKDYPDHHIFRLEQNYRSTKVIVDAANSVIAKNSARIPKECYSMGEQGEKIRLIHAYTEQEEALLIASSILTRIQSEKAEYQDFAILYRTNAQSRALEEALRRRNLPYMIYSGNSFFERAEVKDMMAYFKLVVNVNDNESFKRIVNKPARGIGETSLSALTAAASHHGVPLFKAAYADDLENYGLKPAAIKKIREFCNMIKNLTLMSNEKDAHTVAKKIADLYCTDIERLCGDEIYFDIEEVLSLQRAFIRRLGGIEIKPYKEKIFAEIDKYLSLSKYEVYNLISQTFRDIIYDLHCGGRYVKIETDERVVENFTRNFHDLHDTLKINYRKLGKAIDMSIGNLTRLAQGNEPMLSAVIKLADFFGVSITQMLSENPNFNYEKIQKEIESKTSIANLSPVISDKKIKKDRDLRIELLDLVQSKKIIIKWLNKVNL